MNELSRVSSGAVGNVSLIPQSLEQAVRFAEMMATANLVPAHLQKSPGNCLLVVEQAMRWRMSPFAVAQATSVISGKLNFEGKLVAAALHSIGALSTRLNYQYAGEGDDRTVTVSATLAGEAEPRSMTIRLKDVRTTNQWWQKQPDQQLAYSAARNWARRFAPEVMLGVYVPEEFEAPPPAAAAPQSLHPTIEGQAEETPPARPGGMVEEARKAAAEKSNGKHKVTFAEWLEAVSIRLAGVQSIEDYNLVVAADDVQAAIAKGSEKQRAALEDLLRPVREQFMPAADDGWPSAEAAA